MKTSILIIFGLLTMPFLSNGQKGSLEDLERSVSNIEIHYSNYDLNKMYFPFKKSQNYYEKILKNGEDSVAATKIYIRGLLLTNLIALSAFEENRINILEKETQEHLSALDEIFKNQRLKNALPEHYWAEYYYYKGFNELLQEETNIANAKEYYHKALAFMADSNSTKTLSLLKGQIFNDLGLLETKLGDYNLANVYFQLAVFNYKRDIKVLPKKEAQFIEIKYAVSLSRYVESLIRGKDKTLALEYIDEAINIFGKYMNDELGSKAIKKRYFLLYARMYELKADVLVSAIDDNKKVDVKHNLEQANTAVLSGQEMLNSVGRTLLSKDQLQYTTKSYNIQWIDLLFRQNDKNTAKSLLSKTEKSLNKKEKEEAILFFRVGKIYAKHLKSNSANYYLEKTRELLDKQKDSYRKQTINIQCLTLMAMVHSLSDKEEDWQKGLELCDESLVYVDGVREKILKDGFWGNNYFEFYNVVTNLPFEQGLELIIKLYKKTGNKAYLDKMWSYKEKSKMVTFRKILTQNRFMKNPSYRNDNQIDALFNKIEMSSEAEKETAFYLFYQELIRQDAINKKHIKNQIEGEEKESNFANIVSYNTLQKTLDNSTLLIEFIEHQDSIYIIYLANNGLPNIKTVSNNDNYKKWIQTLIYTTKTRTGELHRDSITTTFLQYKTAAESLYNHLLFDDIFNNLEFNSINRLVFIPNGQLTHLNFEVLLTEKSDSTAYNSKLPYLLKKYTCTYDYSASVWYELQNKAKYVTNDNLLLIETNDTCEYKRGSIVNKTGIDFQYTYKITGEKANDNFKSILKNHSTNILFIRTHGYQNRNPFKAHLLLNCLDTVNYEKFELWELYGKIRLNYNLVILDACVSNYSEVNNNEGMISLTRGFRSTGCLSVVSTLWNVNSTVSTKISIDFIGFLNQGLSKDKALQQAKLKLMNEQKSAAAPYYWAGNILIGNRKPIYF